MDDIDGARSGRRHLVVFVDDERILRDAVRRSLAGHSCQLELAMFARADEALIYVACHAVDLVVLDVFMPGTSGIDACRILRTSGVAIPIAIATGNLTDAIEKAARDAGATYALEKPIDLVDFIATVTRRSGSDRGSSGPRVRASRARNIAGLGAPDGERSVGGRACATRFAGG